jgi:F-type H+-transporting ATPase subunit delta
MSVSKISNRYAKSLLNLCKEKNILEEVVGDVSAFLEMTENRDFELFLRSPIIQSDKKLAVFQELLGGNVNAEMMDFLKMVVRKGRENILPEILEVFLSKYNELKGVTNVVLTSAVELSETEVEKIAAKLKNTSLTSDNVAFTKKVDPALIGGFIIEIDDKRYDASIAGKMQKMKNQLISK